MIIALEILFILILVLLNGLFAMTEFALLKADQDDLGEGRSARAVTELLEEPNRFLSTVQVAITAVGTLAGAVGGATLAESLGELLNTVDILSPHGQAIGVGAVWLAITYVSLIFGELVPKRLALRHPNDWALRLGLFMRGLSKLFLPLVKLLSFSTNLVLKMLGHKPQTQKEVVTESEVRKMIARAVEHGELKQLEHELAEGIFLLDDRLVSELMTPLEELHALRQGDDQERVLKTLEEGSHSRYLLLDSTSDRVLGVVLTRDILRTLLGGRKLELEELAREVPAISKDLDMLGVLDTFKSHATSIVVVTDEKDNLVGLLTAQDFLDSIAGTLHRPGKTVLS